ncbi:hypothetical protein T10_9968 [Trichinella papuae]|uniref:Uncharacterized protein n=1 Tax=Trichinella papuae TaxID=268474 RepID=A0A0V1MTI8_9BILA|nr:hypothetical protein T10_9968 [Trichinella papuae]
MSCCCLEGFGNLFSDLPIWLVHRSVRESYSMICRLTLKNNMEIFNISRLFWLCKFSIVLKNFCEFNSVHAVIDNNDDADQEQ